MDGCGWVFTSDLLLKLNIDIVLLEKIVKENDKKRFEFNQDKSKIRASQGHSIKINLDIPEAIPPLHLFHGTQKANLDLIKASGIKKMNRNHVHLSKDEDTAIIVAKRRGEEFVILTIDALKMKQDGYKFYKSKNKVWLTDHVPSEYIIS